MILRFKVDNIEKKQIFTVFFFLKYYCHCIPCVYSTGHAGWGVKQVLQNTQLRDGGLDSGHIFVCLISLRDEGLNLRPIYCEPK